MYTFMNTIKIINKVYIDYKPNIYKIKTAFTSNKY